MRSTTSSSRREASRDDARDYRESNKSTASSTPDCPGHARSMSASSINSTPPRTSSQTSFVRAAVWEAQPTTRSSSLTSRTSGRRRCARTMGGWLLPALPVMNSRNWSGILTRQLPNPKLSHSAPTLREPTTACCSLRFRTAWPSPGMATSRSTMLTVCRVVVERSSSRPQWLLLALRQRPPDSLQLGPPLVDITSRRGGIANCF
jgi:hypothetical protein